MEDDPNAPPPGGGILGRFDNVRTKKSAKRMVSCEAATPEYIRHDFLKPQNLMSHRVDDELNYAASSNVNETRFHRGFQRRNRADIQSDAARLEVEATRDAIREDRARAQVEAAREYRSKNTFNILTGEGVGRECEFREVGKKILNPFGCMEAVFAEHARDAGNRIRNSKHRFFEPAPPIREDRALNMFNEGLRESARESAVLGYGRSGVRRTRSQSCGVADNFAHLRALPPEPQYEPPKYSNQSQIVFG